MTRKEAAMKLTTHYMSCGMLMPLGWLDKNGEGSELFEAISMAQDALRAQSVIPGCPSCDGGFGDNTMEFAEDGYKFCPYCGRRLEDA